MELRRSPTTLTLLLISTTLLSLTLTASSGGLGVNYGQVANNLPHPETVVPLVKSMGVSRLKLYDADPIVLKAFANTNIEFIVGVGNEYLSTMRDPNQALNWVKSNVKCYLPATKITFIAVGNEVLTANDTVLSSNLLPAMQNIHTALVTLNLHNQIAVTTAHNLGILQTSSPPSAGLFRKDLSPILIGILDFHCKVGSPFLINPYPYFAYKGTNTKDVLDFALFQGNVVDPVTKLQYNSMFHAQIDATHAAMERIGYKNVCLQVSETGWPSKGDADEPGATPENAKKYNENVLKLIQQKKGTPMRPNYDLNVYVFAMFNENQKPGPTSERNFGLFKPDGTPVYDLGFKLSGSGSSKNGSSGGSPSSSFSPVAGSSDGYLAITADDAPRLPSQLALSILGLIVTASLAFRL